MTGKKAKNIAKKGAKKSPKPEARALTAPKTQARGSSTTVTVVSALQFVEKAPISRPRMHIATVDGDTGTVTAALDSAKDQATVVGSDVISFVTGVTADRREAIVNSSLLAQLVATKKVPDRQNIQDWYNAYFDVLDNIGWVEQDRSFSKYEEKSSNFETHKAILAVAATLLGPASTALALVTTTINALHSMDEGRPWITIFNRESQTAKTARFQISLVEQEKGGQFSVSLMAFGLEAKSVITQVLFFKARASEATLSHYSGRVTINTTVIDGVSSALKKKLVGQAKDYVSMLPDLT